MMKRFKSKLFLISFSAIILIILIISGINIVQFYITSNLINKQNEQTITQIKKNIKNTFDKLNTNNYEELKQEINDENTLRIIENINIAYNNAGENVVSKINTIPDTKDTVENIFLIYLIPGIIVIIILSGIVIYLLQQKNLLKN